MWVLAIRQQLNFQAAEALNVETLIPSTRAPSIYMDAELLLTVTERLEQIQERLDAIEKAAEDHAEE